MVVGSSHVLRRLVDFILTGLQYFHKMRDDGLDQTRDHFNITLVYTNKDAEVLPVAVRRKFNVLVTFPEDAILHCAE